MHSSDPSPSSAEPASAPRILVADDIETNRELLRRRLEQLGYRIITARDGREALDMLLEHEVDLLLLDVMMPRMTGYQVLMELRHNTRLRDLPVIIISVLDDVDNVARCLDLGASDYLFKPFNPVLLHARIRQCIELKALRAQAREAQEHSRLLRESFAALHAMVEHLGQASGKLSPSQRAEIEGIGKGIQQIEALCRSEPAVNVARLAGRKERIVNEAS